MRPYLDAEVEVSFPLALRGHQIPFGSSLALWWGMHLLMRSYFVLFLDNLDVEIIIIF